MASKEQLEQLKNLEYMTDPLGRTRFYGIYKAKVVDNNDPLKQGRVKLQIFQPTGTRVTGWVPACIGAIGQVDFPYGTFSTSADQTLGVNAATIINGWAEEDTNGTKLSGTKIYVDETGDYFFQFSAMLIKTNASSGTADIWLRKNGSDIPRSNTRITLQGSNAEVTMTVGFILDLDAGDYVELVGSASSTNTLISASGAGVGPAIPGIIATINLVGKYKPKPGTKVWAMYEAGDPEFPVWIGTRK